MFKFLCNYKTAPYFSGDELRKSTVCSMKCSNYSSVSRCHFSCGDICGKQNFQHNGATFVDP